MSDAGDLREAAEQTMSVTFAEALRNGADAIERVALLEGLLGEAHAMLGSAVLLLLDSSDVDDEDHEDAVVLMDRIHAALGGGK